MSADELLNGDTNQLSYWNDWNTEVHKSFVISNTLPSEAYCHLMSYSMHQEDDEYLKLIEVYDTDGSIPLNKARKEGPSKTSDAVEDENEEEIKKKTKKKTASKKNYGMDIRSCMAAVVLKPHKRRRLDSTDDDVIIVEADDDDIPNRVEGEIGINPCEMNCEEKLGAPIKGAVERSNSINGSSGRELDIAGIFGMEADEFENALYSESMLCGLESDIGMCLRLGKIFSDPPTAPKPKCVDIDVFKFQCDQLLKLMDSVSAISFEPNESYRSLVVPQKQGCRTASPVTPNPGDTEDKQEIGTTAAKNDSFVDVDDLFGDDSFCSDVDLNVGSFRERGNSLSQEKACAASQNKRENNINDNVDLSPIKKSSEFSSVWGSNSVFAELSPVGKAPPQVDRPIISSTPINPHKALTRRESPLAQPPKDQNNLWLLDDILEEDELVRDEVLKKGSSDPHHSSKDLFSTTPGSKIFKVAAASNPPASMSSRPKYHSDEDFWCLDDLFEDEVPEDTLSKDPKNETSFYGITQMVSQIEKDKLLNRQRNVPMHVSGSSAGDVPSKPDGVVRSQKTSPAGLVELKNVPSGKGVPESQTSPSSKLQKNVDCFGASCKQLNVDTTCAPKNMTISPIHILDSDPEDEIPNENARPVLTVSTDLKSPQKETPIIVIDSDSASPPISSSHADERPSQDKSNLPKKSDEASSRLLDEDDDVFNKLCGGGFEETKLSALNTITSKRTSQSQNFKKFKRKSLLSHLDSEPENDFPPEKRDKAPDETFNLRVGSSSKRKLSFEDLLGDIGEATSKRFASNPPKEPDKPALKLSYLPLSAVSSKRIPEPWENSPSEEDIFIRPLGGKSTEKVSRAVSPLPVPSSPANGRCADEVPQNETRASSSTSTPVKVPQKKKAKKRSKRKGDAFIEDQADESGAISTDDSDNSSLDDMDDSFVNDESDQELSYAHYLKTVKSPVAGGKFKIPMNRRYMGNVYSQVVNNVDDEYENDSFCVDSDEGNSPEESTILECAERKLTKKQSCPTKKRILQPESGDSDFDERVADLSTLTALPVPNQKTKRRLLESDSDVTPERPPPKRPRNRIISPAEGEKTLKSEEAPSTSADFVIPGAVETLPAVKTTTAAEPTVKVDSDSDEDLKEAIRLSVLESTTKKSAEEKFEEDLQKALFLSQCEVAGPSEPVKNGDNFPSPGDHGTSLLFMSQPILLDKKPLSTKSRTKTKTATNANNKGFKKVFELSDSD